MRDDMREIAIARIRIRENVRHGSLAVADLAADISAHGLINPILVRRTGDGFELVAGHRRLAACRELRWETVPCRITDGHDATRLELQLAENIQREDLSPYEVGLALRKLRDSVDSIQELALQVRRSYPWVFNRLEYADLYEDLRRDGIDEAHLARVPMDTLLEFKAVSIGDRARLVRELLPADPEKPVLARARIRQVLEARRERARESRKKPLSFVVHRHGLVLTLEFRAKIDARRITQVLLERGGRIG